MANQTNNTACHSLKQHGVMGDASPHPLGGPS